MALIGNTLKIKSTFTNFDGNLNDATDITIDIYEDGELLETIPIDVSHKVATGIYEYYYVIPDGSIPLIVEVTGYVDGNVQKGQDKIIRFTRRRT